MDITLAPPPVRAADTPRLLAHFDHSTPAYDRAIDAWVYPPPVDGCDLCHGAEA